MAKATQGKAKTVNQAISEDALLADNDVKCSLSIAYVQAIAAHAGYLCGSPPEPDRDSVDLQIAAGGLMRPKLDLQLKASIRLTNSGTNFSFPLKLKNYNDLRVPTQTPRLLIVLDLPKKSEHWLKSDVKQLVLRRAAYWVSLRDLPEAASAASVTIIIPKSNIFDVKALIGLMEQSRSGRIK